jgi:hypothetical protein
VTRAIVLGAVLAAGLLAACGEPASESPVAAEVVSPRDSAAVIIERARRVHGADVLDRADVSFSFRGTPFTVRRDGGAFEYARIVVDSGDVVRDVLDNDGFRRTVGGRPVTLPEAEARAAEGAVNSVVYFALLPYPLADPAVQSRLVGADTLGGEPYRLVEVTFRPEGGGRDYQDRFLYWIHRDRSTVDYLAYSYDVNDGGIRFREAFNPRTVGGVRFADYRNYAPDSVEPRLEALAQMFEADSLTLVSEIVLDSVRVTLLGREDGS